MPRRQNNDIASSDFDAFYLLVLIAEDFISKRPEHPCRLCMNPNRCDPWLIGLGLWSCCVPVTGFHRNGASNRVKQRNVCKYDSQCKTQLKTHRKTHRTLGPLEPWTLGPLDLWTLGPLDPRSQHQNYIICA